MDIKIAAKLLDLREKLDGDGAISLAEQDILNDAAWMIIDMVDTLKESENALEKQGASLRESLYQGHSVLKKIRFMLSRLKE